MRRTLRVLAFAFCLSASGCMTGPSYLWRWVDDEQNKNYAESPGFTAMVTDVFPIYPIIKALAWIPDFLILNPVQFWGFDIWRGKGAPFQHDNPMGGEQPWFKKDRGW